MAKIIGHTTATPTPVSDWNQTDNTKSDYIKNKPDINSIIAQNIADLVDSAPVTLNTLNELAAALGDDPNFATTIVTQIGSLETKVGDAAVAEQINSAVSQKSQVQIITWEADD